MATVIRWIATDFNGDTFLYRVKPLRFDLQFKVDIDDAGSLDYISDAEIFGLKKLPTWEDEPIKIKITI